MSAGASHTPYYLATGDEEEIFRAAYAQRLPVMLVGPTGSGKTRFLEHMSWKLSEEDGSDRELTSISCHEDLTASDLIGRYLLDSDGTRWVDGPLTTAVREGSICYLDEVVEARKDTIVLIHSLTDHRRTLPLTKLGQTIEAHPDFLLVISFNPGYQSSTKDLKTSTRQRFVTIDFDYPPEEQEAEIIAAESGLANEGARRLAAVGAKLRVMAADNRAEGPSTRLLVYAAEMIGNGIDEERACAQAFGLALIEDAAQRRAALDVVRAVVRPPRGD